MPSGSVVVVGSVNVDLVVRGARLPRAGETVIGGTFSKHHGGKGANAAVAAARAGARIALVAAVGADPFGDEQLAHLNALGVEVSRIARHDDVATGVALIAVDASGENQIAVASGANAELSAPHVARALRALLSRGDVVLANLEVPDDAVVAAAEAARAAGARFILNPAPFRALPPRLALDGAILTPNETEARALLGLADGGPIGEAVLHVARAHALLTRIEALIVTLGAEGALLARADRTRHVPAARVDVVDTTGAGDAFNGVLAASLAAGRPLEEALERAVVAGGLAATKVGAQEGMPTAAEIDDFLARSAVRR